jgi:hypothetical protein
MRPCGISFFLFACRYERQVLDLVIFLPIINKLFHLLWFYRLTPKCLNNNLFVSAKTLTSCFAGSILRISY